MCIFFPFQVQTVRTHRFCCVIQGKGLRELVLSLIFMLIVILHCIDLSLSTSAYLGSTLECERCRLAHLLSVESAGKHFFFHHMLRRLNQYIDTQLLFHWSWILDIAECGVRSTDSVSLASFYSRTAGTRMQTNKVPRPHAEYAFVL